MPTAPIEASTVSNVHRRRDELAKDSTSYKTQPLTSLMAHRAALEARSAEGAAAAERVRAAEAAEAEAEAALEAGGARLRELRAQTERLRELEAREKLGVQARPRQALNRW